MNKAGYCIDFGEGGGPRDRTRRTPLRRTGIPLSGDPEVGVMPGASLRQDIAPVILRSRVPLSPEPHSKPGGGPVPLLQAGGACVESGLDAGVNFVERFRMNSGLLKIISRLAALQLSLLALLRDLHSLKFSSSFQISRMKSKPDLAPDSSSIGGRVSSKKQRYGVDCWGEKQILRS
ncbi:hypothetical protein F2Q69_00036224 [Brassica cretica]|uniref:Uncharacterized protein n=1 Tax=Brassica cretica TaxID=69181 RepID=A0A8S9SGU5_BRACR|nr:hypothetical protein F2Q69_00036224 [Brassica cretica]